MLNVFVIPFLLLAGQNVPGPCDTVPELNKAIVAFVEDHVGERVGSGECWDLAAEALNTTGASWDGEYAYGVPVNPMKDCVHPGDIIRFQHVKLRHFENGRTRTDEMSEHTAVITAVNGRGIYQLGHQNTQETGRKVGYSDIDLHHVVSGKYTVYRPSR